MTEYPDVTIEEIVSAVGRPKDARLDPTAEPTVEILYWTAGLLEGRGSFANVGGTPRLTLQSNLGASALARLKKYWGGSVYDTATNNHFSGRRLRWVLTGRRVMAMLRQVRPYLSKARIEGIKKALKIEGQDG